MTIIERDPETGRIISKKLSSEEARELGKISHRKAEETRVNALLREAGIDPTDAPEHIRLLAEYSSAGKAGSVAALRDFRRLTLPSEVDIQTQENTCEYFSHCLLHKAYSGRWEPGEKDAEIAAAKQRIAAYRKEEHVE